MRYRTDVLPDGRTKYVVTEGSAFIVASHSMGTGVGVFRIDEGQSFAEGFGEEVKTVCSTQAEANEYLKRTYGWR